MEEKQNIYSPLVIVVAVIIIILAGWFLWNKKSIAPATESDVVDVGKALENVSNVSNPAEDVGGKIPDTNPFGAGNTTNPFKGYKNPFGN
ncbi:MAG: hypothetical protein HYT28_01480 [Parcubacteria group bacterium]|nr:hypothetical protein [Parcubacteria group bacterium]